MGRALRLSRISNGPRACMGPARVHETRKGSQGAVVKRRWDGRQGSIARASKGCVGTPAREYTPDPYIFFDPGGLTTPKNRFFIY